MQLTEAVANEIYDILVEVCDARDNEVERTCFVRAFTKDRGTQEFRFIGSLDFGGKFWNCNDKFYVTCYEEHRTPERLATIAGANERLAEVYKRVVGQSLAQAEGETK